MGKSDETPPGNNSVARGLARDVVRRQPRRGLASSPPPRSTPSASPASGKAERRNDVSRGLMVTRKQAQRIDDLTRLISRHWGEVGHSQVTRALWAVLSSRVSGIAQAVARHGGYRAAPARNNSQARAVYERELVAFLADLLTMEPPEGSDDGRGNG